MTSDCSSITVSSDTAEIVEYIRAQIGLDDIQVGALKDLRGFLPHMKHVICLVKVDGGGRYPRGTCVYLIMMDNGQVALELCTSLDMFWNYWEWQVGGVFPEAMPMVVEEIHHFFATRKPKRPDDFVYRDGAGNQQAFREMRSAEKCRQLESIFGLKLLPS